MWQVQDKCQKITMAGKKAVSTFPRGHGRGTTAVKDRASTHSAAAASSACIDHMCQPCTAFKPDDNTTGESVKEGIRSNFGKAEYRHEDKASAVDNKRVSQANTERR